jgi:hypothetical protein
MDNFTPKETLSDTPISALAGVGTAVLDLVRNSKLSSENKEKLRQAHLLIREVFIAVTSGADAKAQSLEEAQREGFLALGEKRYTFRSNPETVQRTAVVEKEGKSYPLPEFSEDEHSWGYAGTGPSRLTWKIINDCFAGEHLSLAKQSEIYGRLYPKVTLANRQLFVLYEHEIRELL